VRERGAFIEELSERRNPFGANRKRKIVWKISITKIKAEDTWKRMVY
jgi:hypothetical protein